MMGPTHVAGGALAGLSASAAAGLDVDQAIALTAGAVLASRLPDVDAKLNPGPAHRGFPHSLVFGGGGAVLATLFLVGWLRSPETVRLLGGAGIAGGPVSPESLPMVVIGAAIGYLAHLALDACTSAGIWLFLPRGRRVGIPKRYAVKTGGVAEKMVGLAIVAGCCLLGLYVFGPAISPALANVSRIPTGHVLVAVSIR